MYPMRELPCVERGQKEDVHHNTERFVEPFVWRERVVTRLGD